MLIWIVVRYETHPLAVALPRSEGVEQGQLREQLSLPLPGLIEKPPHGMSIPKQDRVYANRNLRMGSIDWIGFDMDYTLAIYHQEAMDALSVRLTAERLVERGYPELLMNLDFDTRFPIRGLLIDKKLGNILKMDRHKAVNLGYHGMKRLSKAELEDLYHHQKLRPESARFHWIDTLFGLSEVTTFVSVLSALEEAGETIDYERLFQDIRDSIDVAHADGTVHRKVLEDLPRFIARDPDLAVTLHKFRSAGKKLFLLTNSPWEYTDGMMHYLLHGALPQYRSWTMYFNVVNVSARKPLWFQGREPFFEIKDGKRVGEATKLERGKVYEGGNREGFEQMTNSPGSRVLYVGDHIYGDILRSKKDSTWRTAMIIQELDRELLALRVSADNTSQKLELEQSRQRLEDELRFYQRRLKAMQQANGQDSRKELARIRSALDEVRKGIRQIDQRDDDLEGSIDATYHPYWGSLLKEGGELSSFGAQVERYADLYMRRVSCLRHYSPEQFFRSPHDFMPHEL